MSCNFYFLEGLDKDAKGAVLETTLPNPKIDETKRAPLATDEIGDYPDTLNPFEQVVEGNFTIFYLVVIF